MSILAQKQVYDINDLIKDPAMKMNGKVAIPQDMETITRSFYFIITKDHGLSLDFIPPGKKYFI